MAPTATLQLTFAALCLSSDTIAQCMGVGRIFPGGDSEFFQGWGQSL